MEPLAWREVGRWGICLFFTLLLVVVTVDLIGNVKRLLWLRRETLKWDRLKGTRKKHKTRRKR